MNLQSITYNNEECFDFKEVITEYPRLSKATRGLWKDFSQKHSIPEDQVYSLSLKDGKYNPCKPTYNRARFLIKKDYVNDQLIPLVTRQITKVPEIIEEDVELETLPDPIVLDDDERFRTPEGKFFDVDTRGSRKYDEIYFKAKDVGLLFEMRIKETIFEVTSVYRKHIDYEIFCGDNIYSDNTLVQINKKKPDRFNNTYLTYKGLMHAVYTSRNSVANSFQDWACKILFTYQFGTKEQKIESASKLINVPIKVFKSFLRLFAHDIAGLYIYDIGSVKKYNKELDKKTLSKLDDDDRLYKIGLTKDLAQRLMKHKGKSAFGLDIEPVLFTIIDTSKLSKAEIDLKDTITHIGSYVNLRDQDEIVTFKKDKIKFLKEFMTSLRVKYSFDSVDLKDQLSEATKMLQDQLNNESYEKELSKTRHEKELNNERYEKELNNERYEKELNNERHEKELNNERHEKELINERHEKELINERHEKELLKKDVEILQLKLTLTSQTR